MDGFVEQSIPVKTFYVFSCVEDDATTSYEMTYEETNYLIHHNFGWGGYETGAGAYSENNLPMGTGWYNLGIFSSRSGRKYSSNAFKSNSDGNYKHDVQIIYVIK